MQKNIHKNISNPSPAYVIFEDRRSDSSLLKKLSSLLSQKTCQTALRIEAEILLLRLVFSVHGKKSAAESLT